MNDNDQNNGVNRRDFLRGGSLADRARLVRVPAWVRLRDRARPRV